MVYGSFLLVLLKHCVDDLDNEPNKTPINWLARQNAAPLKFDPKPSEAAFSTVFLNFNKCRPAAADDVISSMAIE